MPEIGEIKQGQAIGKTIWKAHIWQACLDCGKERWVLLKKGKPASLRCLHCARQRQVGINHPSWKGGKEHWIYLRREKRQKIIKMFGGKCATCGYNTDIRAFQIDHINGGGNVDRKSFTSLTTYYNHVIACKGEGYQLLCANCNLIKKIEKGENSKYYQQKLAVNTR